MGPTSQNLRIYAKPEIGSRCISFLYLTYSMSPKQSFRIGGWEEAIQLKQRTLNEAQWANTHETEQSKETKKRNPTCHRSDTITNEPCVKHRRSSAVWVLGVCFGFLVPVHVPWLFCWCPVWNLRHKDFPIRSSGLVRRTPESGMQLMISLPPTTMFNLNKTWACK